MKKLAWALLLSSALPACSLIEPLGDVTAGGADDSSSAGTGNGNGNGGSGKGDGGGDTTTLGGSGTTANGGSGDTTSGGSGVTTRGGAGGVSPSGGAAPTGGSTGTAGTGGGPQTGPYCSAAVTPCGGSLIGTWTIQSTCLILSTSDPTIPAACQDALGFLTYSVAGTVSFDGASLTADISSDIVQTLKYTTSCITALHASNSGYPPPPASSACSTLAANQITNGATTANCPYDAANGGSCDCTLGFMSSGTGTDNYTLTGTGQYVDESDPPGYPVSFCVNGNTLTTSQSSPSGQVIQHVLTR
ncbi:MAG TPA: hypothetical protein VK745_13915 [Polyangiaceae bacterium]|nr:hypothetical protein [Polyangiaceae bacterium]